MNQQTVNDVQAALDAEIVAELKLGHVSYRDIATKFGVSQNQVFLLARVNGIKRKPGRGSTSFKRKV